MIRRPRLRLVPLVLASFMMTGCVEELSQIFDIILFSESDDPEVRETGEVLADLRDEREAADEIDRWLETGDRSHLDNAIRLRPGDTEYRGYDLALATLGGDSAQIEAAKEALALAEAQRLSALTERGDPPVTAEMLRRNVLGEVLVAQTRMLGGSLTRPWDPPPDDAPPEQQQLFADYCATKAQIERDFADDLSHIPTPPCP